ncbi:MAG: tRNA preQ1(34) S-adenosylmethionine ribosyltransferase-isomerase QueA [Eubacteriales bacterium]|nr:tRNA preQ1(34) S-adenosylmethionine ribosyltransferase-isomerase QueA [Eubacteriales bacterium]
MKTSDFYFDLPEELIAQDPLEDRSSSRLMVLHKETGEVCHRTFRDVLEYLHPGDCLVINDTKVIPARLIGVREDTGAKIELLLLKRKENDVWETLVKPGKKCRTGARVVFGNGELRAEILDVLPDGNRLVQFSYEGIFEEVLDRLGQMPLPPYITHKLQDKNRYQTVYAKYEGSAAAPTAGLHFTKELLGQIEDMGVHIARVTLHVGLGTFRPVKVENVLEHHMHSEYYHVSKEAADIINATRQAGGRVISVGTTSTRTLESVADADGTIHPGSGNTEIFIYPGYTFKAIDALITNFHLPESTLLMLVSALAGKEHVLAAYDEAVKERYRFFSFGDAMLIV